MIIMPLQSLIVQQNNVLVQHGFKSVICSTKDECYTALNNDTTHIFMSPESLANSMMKLDLTTCMKISHVFIDESHCVVNWYV